MTSFQAIILGIVQGLTEFLPISSSAHLRIVPHLLGWEDPGAAFSAVIQLGTLLAVMIYFREDIVRLVLATLQSLKNRNLMETQDSRLAWAIAAGNVPIVILGLTFKDFIKTEARTLPVIGSTLIILAIFLYFAEMKASQKKEIKDLNFLQIQWIGLCQALALIPGTSRSGSTIMGGLFLGLKREDAARFSFLLGLPAIFGSGLFELKDLLDTGLGENGMLPIILGTATAFVSGYVSIDWLLGFLKTHGTHVFIIYRILLGSAILLSLAFAA